MNITQESNQSGPSGVLVESGMPQIVFDTEMLVTVTIEIGYGLLTSKANVKMPVRSFIDGAQLEKITKQVFEAFKTNL